jgi:hypothetical protein
MEGESAWLGAEQSMGVSVFSYLKALLTAGEPRWTQINNNPYNSKPKTEN